MSKNKYRPKLNLRPKAGNPTPADQPRSDRERAVADAFKRLGGERFERDVARLDRLLEVHDREVEKLLAGDADKHRWQVSPAMVVRIQREIQQLLHRRDQAMEAAKQEVDATERLFPPPFPPLPKRVGYEARAEAWPRQGIIEANSDEAAAPPESVHAPAL
jgi:hypothetical protein